MADEKTIIVRDKSGIFYAFTPNLLKQAALTDPEDIKKATQAWERKEADVEGQSMGGVEELMRWGSPTAVAGVRG